jgi:hypothetical protein
VGLDDGFVGERSAESRELYDSERVARDTVTSPERDEASDSVATVVVRLALGLAVACDAVVSIVRLGVGLEPLLEGDVLANRVALSPNDAVEAVLEMEREADLRASEKDVDAVSVAVPLVVLVLPSGLCDTDRDGADEETERSAVPLVVLVRLTLGAVSVASTEGEGVTDTEDVRVRRPSVNDSLALSLTEKDEECVFDAET